LAEGTDNPGKAELREIGGPCRLVPVARRLARGDTARARTNRTVGEAALDTYAMVIAMTCVLGTDFT
jgi:hypothetical protein